jgi:hypothetical protein
MAIRPVFQPVCSGKDNHSENVLDLGPSFPDNQFNTLKENTMSRNPPVPVCKAFLICRQIVEHTLTLMGANCHVARRFPSGLPVAFFARLRGGHGQYAIEVQLQNGTGDVLWRDGPADLWSPQSPLDTLDLVLNYIPIFPGPGDYSLVLTANGEELSREFFAARLMQAPVSQ